MMKVCLCNTKQGHFVKRTWQHAFDNVTLFGVSQTIFQIDSTCCSAHVYSTASLVYYSACYDCDHSLNYCSPPGIVSLQGLQGPLHQVLHHTCLVNRVRICAVVSICVCVKTTVRFPFTIIWRATFLDVDAVSAHQQLHMRTQSTSSGDTEVRKSLAVKQSLQVEGAKISHDADAVKPDEQPQHAKLNGSPGPVLNHANEVGRLHADMGVAHQQCHSMVTPHLTVLQTAMPVHMSTGC